MGKSNKTKELRGRLEHNSSKKESLSNVSLMSVEKHESEESGLLRYVKIVGPDDNDSPVVKRIGIRKNNKRKVVKIELKSKAEYIKYISESSKNRILFFDFINKNKLSKSKNVLDFKKWIVYPDIKLKDDISKCDIISYSSNNNELMIFESKLRNKSLKDEANLHSKATNNFYSSDDDDINRFVISRRLNKKQ